MRLFSAVWCGIGIGAGTVDPGGNIGTRARTERLFEKLMGFSFFALEVPSSVFGGKIEKTHTTTHATLGGAG